MRTTLTQRGRSLLTKKTIALRPKPITRKPPPEPLPVEWPYMSTWEVRVARALQARAIAFTPQVTYEGGSSILGGMKVDFVLPDFNAVLRIMGYWHTLPSAQARDALQLAYLRGRGFTVIDLWEADMEDLDAALALKLGTPIRAGG